jgi:hypothetical protein
VRDQVITRTLPEVVRFFTLWKKHVYRSARHDEFNITSSAHLQIENQRILVARTLTQRGAIQPKPVSRQPSAGASEEEKSIVNVKIDGRNVAAYTTCAACRTRQSNVWWKAPKGLFTAVLCDDCGVHWRKYGDLSLKTPKEDSLPSTKQRMAMTEKREGTPLTGPVPKRIKVCIRSIIIDQRVYMPFRLLLGPPQHLSRR